MKININNLNGASSIKIYNYLLNESKETNKPFRFLTIDVEDERETNKIVSVFLDMFSASTTLTIDDIPIIFYDEEEGFEIKNILSSIVDDFAININVFNSGKIKSRDSFIKVFEAYKKYLKNKKNQYSSVSDLIIEIVKEDIKKISEYKKILLNGIYDDPQLEKLIISMFDNNLNVTKTASDMYMHRNTINNKLNYIKQETSLNIQDFKDALSMYWLVKAK